MELILAHKTETEIDVSCDGHYSHSFELQTLPANNEKELSHLLANQRHRVVHFMGHGGQDQLGEYFHLLSR
jgi:hypothetical protein